MTESTLQITATAEKGPVSARLSRPDDSRALIVLAHGAGANMLHQHMQSITSALERQGLATLRFNFPYMEAGGKRTDSKPVCIEAISNAVDLANTLASDLPLFLGGHSFGGRMSSHAIDERNAYGEIFDRCRGLIYFSFPLHPSKKPDIKRADHLYSIKIPMLFLSGTRDSLADSELLEDVSHRIPNAELHWLDTADHGFKILKRSRQSAEDVYQEAARVTASFVDKHL
jgi:predicted alpha/beta-hydrolase family hydrolase